MKFKFFQKTTAYVVIAFLLSSIFRLYNFDLIEFKSDEATTVYQTFRFFEQPYLIERGLISGTGVYNFPLFNYLMIILATWSQDPQFLSGIIALINSLLVSVFFLFIRKYYGFITALFASLLLAFSPWGIIFSRKIWAQDLILLFFIPILWFLHEIILRKNTKVVFPMFLLLVLLAQLHGSGLFLLIVTVLIFLVFRVRFSLKSAAAGVLVGLIPAIPYFLFQFNSACPDCEAFVKYKNSIRIFDFNNLLRPLQVTGGLGYHFVLGRNYSDFISIYPFVNYLKYIFTLGFFGIITGVIFVIFKERKYLFLVIYFVSVPFLYLITKTPAYMHYFVITLPVSILLFAILINAIYSYVQSKYLKMMTVALFSIFIAANILFNYFFNNFIELKKGTEGDYGPIYSFTKNSIEKEIEEYKSLSYYQELQRYAYIYAQSKDLHSKLSEFFLEKGAYELAEKELQR